MYKMFIEPKLLNSKVKARFKLQRYFAEIIDADHSTVSRFLSTGEISDRFSDKVIKVLGLSEDEYKKIEVTKHRKSKKEVSEPSKVIDIRENLKGLEFVKEIEDNKSAIDLLKEISDTLSRIEYKLDDQRATENGNNYMLSQLYKELTGREAV